MQHFGDEISWKTLIFKIEKEMGLRKVGCEDGKEMKSLQNRVKWQTFGVSSVEPLGAATRIIKATLKYSCWQ